MTDQWYFEREGAPAGPITFAELQRLAASGIISRATRAWSEGMTDWVPAGTIPQLFEAASPALAAQAFEAPTAPRVRAHVAPTMVPLAAPPPPMSMAAARYCSSCGQPIHPYAEICPNCGVRQRGQVGSKNKTTAALLAIFLGAFGAHKFYLGQSGLGVLYLLFFWTFIPGFIALIEFVIYLTMTDEAFAAKYG